jgi:predicted NodU family carbamoyl transferase
MRKILGISAFYHDSAAALTIDGKVVAAAQEERFTRDKHTPDFPKNAIKYCLDFAGLEIDDLDAIVFYDKPLLKFERLLETYYAFAPKGIASFLKAIPVWLNEKMFLKKLIFDGLKEIGTYDKKKVVLLFPEHHLSHAASAFYPSPYEKAAILTNGVPRQLDWAKATKFRCSKNSIFRILSAYCTALSRIFSVLRSILASINSWVWRLTAIPKRLKRRNMLT